MKFLATLSFALLLTAGCVSKPAPKGPPLEPAVLITQLRDREAHIRTASGHGDVTLTRPDGQSVNLATAVAVGFPDHVRLRAWKMGQAVFDLTLKPQGVWLLVADPDRRKKILPAGTDAASFLRGWSSLQGRFFSAADLQIESVQSDTLWLKRTIETGQLVRCEVDRSSAQVRRFLVYDGDGQQRFALEYERYKTINGYPWPMRMRTRSGQGAIQVDLDEVELNAPLAENAFVPPRRAEKLP